ncbi:transforming protein [Alces alces papillomavirus 1]|uniref:Protein E7 n=1 Tax=European elk papillomavirus TaxID=2885846 RepID=VE7_PAPVE|nr:transforming protein [Alces alces papillomavirus 1]P11332.1 RecName: Full=Protein E7 [Alces alces papillomavirus 1]AAA66850.1 transforming protein [Alces alces papillomavirus 1]
MVHGPRTKKHLPPYESPPLTLLLEPVAPVQQTGIQAPQRKPPSQKGHKKGHKKVYSVTVPCNGCDKNLEFCARTSSATILTLQNLLLKDLDFLCSTCETNHG